MASLWFSLITIAWMSNLSIYLVKGRGMPKNASLVANQQIFTQVALQTASKMDATNEQIYLHHWAVLIVEGEYYGAMAGLNVYGLPTVTNGQSSSIQILVFRKASGPSESFNLISAGWHVYPEHYGDHGTHFFVIWTADENYQTGCYNFNCKGFVGDNTSELVPGQRLEPLSEFNGEQRFITLKIAKNGAEGDWWLYSGLDGTKPVGYWPKSLFTSLANNAGQIHIGGNASFLKGKIGPPMGSGLFATEGEGKAASIKYPRLLDENGSLYAPYNNYYYTDKEYYYKVTGDVASTLYVGGPGGCKD